MILLGMMALAGAGQPATAPTAMSSEPDIIVIGERAGRSARRTPSSVVVFTARDIDSQAFPDRIEQLLALTPNVQLGSGGEGPTIRGQDSTGPLRDLPAFLGGTRPRVTLAIDGRAVSYSELAFGHTPLWDVAQVEIYRSPQSSTQGRNAIGGAIFLTSASPSFEVSGKARVIFGDARTRHASAVVTGPLIADQLAIRLSGDIRRSRSSSRITSPADADPDRDDGDNLRAKLLVTPSALPGARIELIYARLAAQMPQIEGISPPYRERRDPFASYGIVRTRVHSFTDIVDQALGPGLDLKATATYGVASIRRFAPPGFGVAQNRGRDGSLLFGFSPVARLTLERNRSTLDIHDYRRTRTEFGIARSF